MAGREPEGPPRGRTPERAARTDSALPEGPPRGRTPERAARGHPNESTAGARAEALAAVYLEARGLAIIERNFRRRCGEIDLVARDGTTLVFVEVRLRRGQAFGGAAASITAAKRARLLRAAGLYLARLSGTPDCRIDAVLLDALDERRIEWLQDVISAG